MKRGAKKKIDAELFKKLYYEDSKSLAEIGRMFEISRVAIYKIAKGLGIKRRNKSEARILAQKAGKLPQAYKAINDRFFSAWNPQMAYVLGLIMTDGCLTKSRVVSLSLNDKELLEKVANAMSSEHTIAASRHQKGLYTYSFGRINIVQDLIGLGVSPRKSLNLKFPDVPKEYLRDFVRGVFDGDGSVFYVKLAKNSPLQCKFFSGSKTFIVGLKSALESLGMPKKRIIVEKRKNLFYYLRYAHGDSLKLFNILYRGLKSDLYLKRKYDKFRAVIKA